MSIYLRKKGQKTLSMHLIAHCCKSFLFFSINFKIKETYLKRNINYSILYFQAINCVLELHLIFLACVMWRKRFNFVLMERNSLQIMSCFSQWRYVIRVDNLRDDVIQIRNRKWTTLSIPNSQRCSPLSQGVVGMVSLG